MDINFGMDDKQQTNTGSKKTSHVLVSDKQQTNTGSKKTSHAQSNSMYRTLFDRIHPLILSSHHGNHQRTH
eukprot:scaffold75237_cov72-Attheya_sp.AAC.2